MASLLFKIVIHSILLFSSQDPPSPEKYSDGPDPPPSLYLLDLDYYLIAIIVIIAGLCKINPADFIGFGIIKIQPRFVAYPKISAWVFEQGRYSTIRKGRIRVLWMMTINVTDRAIKAVKALNGSHPQPLARIFEERISRIIG